MSVVQFRATKPATEQFDISLEKIFEVISTLQLYPRKLATKHSIPVKHEMYGTIPKNLLGNLLVTEELNSILKDLKDGIQNPRIDQNLIVMLIDLKLESLSDEILHSADDDQNSWVIISLIQAARKDIGTFSARF